MKNASYLLAAVLLMSSCSAGVYHDRYGTTVAVDDPVDVWGTVTYVDPVAHRIDLDYVDAGVHRSRAVYYDERATRWDGVKYSEVHNGDSLAFHGRTNHGRWTAESASRHQDDHNDHNNDRH